MPRRSRVSAWLPYWPVLVGVVSLVGWGVASLRQHAVNDFKRDEQIRVLTNIVGSEFPQYSPMLWPME